MSASVEASALGAGESLSAEEAAASTLASLVEEKVGPEILTAAEEKLAKVKISNRLLKTSGGPAVRLNDAQQKIVKQVLKGITDEERREAIASIEALSTKERSAICKYLSGTLAAEEDPFRRSWGISALAATRIQHAVEALSAFLDPDQEQDSWVRYWAAVGLARLRPSNLSEYLQIAEKDPELMVQAVRLRLLIENGSEELLEEWENLARSEDWTHQFWACKVMRRSAGGKPLSERVEEKIFGILEFRLLDDRYGAVDVRYQAALALGDLQYKWPEAVKALNRALEENLPDFLRRACIDALTSIAKPETMSPLFFALSDSDAEIRVRSAKGLQRAAGGDDAATRYILERILQQDSTNSQYLDALRWISHKSAEEQLADFLMHPDPKLADRAQSLLTQLGGEGAFRSLQAQRNQAINKYTEILSTADAQIMEQFQVLMSQAGMGFRLSMWMHGIIFGLGVVVLILSLYVSLAQGFSEFQRYVGAAAAAGSLGTLLLLFYKDPLKNIRESVTNLVKVDVVFLGYVRQINQIDATFKQLFLSKGSFGTEQMDVTVTEIRDAVQQTMDQIKTNLVT